MIPEILREAGKPYVVLRQAADPANVTLFSGNIEEVEKLADVRELGGNGAEIATGRRAQVIFMVPFCQLKEKGFKVRDNGEKIICLVVDAAVSMPVTEFVEELEKNHLKEFSLQAPLKGNIAVTTGVPCCFDTTEAEYEEIVRNVLEKEIKSGEGSSFVTPRTMTSQIMDFDRSSPLSIFQRLILDESGSYWTFLFCDGSNFFCGASPERHLTVAQGKISMNPISGTFRKRVDHWDGEQEGTKCGKFREEMSSFLQDKKEIDELFMVTDEELKMMCRMSPYGGKVIGPVLKDMSHLVHTEYTLQGTLRENCTSHPIELLRQSMFAPTVTGSPMGNACSRLYEYELKSRGYYSSAICMLGLEKWPPENTQGLNGMAPFIDSSITIRTLEIDGSGLVTARVGATLVKDSVPSEEVKETEWKLRGVLSSLEKAASCKSLPPAAKRVAADPSGKGSPNNAVAKSVPPKIGEAYNSPQQLRELQTLLEERNKRTSHFWKTFHSEIQAPHGVDLSSLKGKRCLLMECEDDFIHMTAHMLMTFGMSVEVANWADFESRIDAQQQWDFFVIGPGPGDPSSEIPKMVTMRRVMRRLLDSAKSDKPMNFICICLGHQILCGELGVKLVQKDVPLQGVQVTCSLFEKENQLLGFYNSFHADSSRASEVIAEKQGEGFELSLDEQTNQVVAIRSPQFVSFQFHPESILTREGPSCLLSAVKHVCAASVSS